jgi:uncharacterized protein YdeI (BOF family)
MKIFVAVFVVVLITALVSLAGQTSGTAVPKYDPAQERTFIGTVENFSDRNCPVSGGLGSHVLLKLESGQTIEVHLARSSFVKRYDLKLAKGEHVEVIGVKVKFEDADTIFAREIKRGGDLYMFRDTSGKPIW